MSLLIPPPPPPPPPCFCFLFFFVGGGDLQAAALSRSGNGTTGKDRSSSVGGSTFADARERELVIAALQNAEDVSWDTGRAVRVRVTIPMLFNSHATSLSSRRQSAMTDWYGSAPACFLLLLCCVLRGCRKPFLCLPDDGPRGAGGQAPPCEV